MTDLISLSPAHLEEWLRERSIRRFFFVREGDQVRPSHDALEPVARWIAECSDFHDHEGVFLQRAERTGVIQSAAVHRTCRGQGAGGVRFWHYDNFGEILRDGLRLARGMTHKNALAGLWWGGGKGVMVRGTGLDPADAEARRKIYEDYGDFMSSLRGCYVTAEDVGTSVEDMAAVFSRTRFTTCIPSALGGSGNPSVPTARGVVSGMEAGLDHLDGKGLSGRSVAIQGLGHVGEPLIGFLLEAGVTRIVGSDLDPSRADALHELFPGAPLELRQAKRGDDSILFEDVDVVAPCATGATLNPETIPSIRARLICGAANNQLELPGRDDDSLAAQGVLYLPDFLVNRMGIVTCADEQAGYPTPDPLIERHLGRDWEGSVYRTTLQVLEEAEKKACTPAKIALELAEERSLEPHPLFGHRGVEIVRSLAEGGWAD